VPTTDTEAVALHEERAFAARLLAEQESHAQRLAAALHEGIAQEITGISMLVAALAKRARAEGSSLAPALAEVQSLLATAIASCRGAARAHGDYVVREEGLARALERIAADASYGPRLELECAEFPGPVDDFAVHQLYCIASEAIENARRHSRGRVIRVRCGSRPGGVGIEVEDDGVGLAGACAGSGLALMGYRARAIGAELSLAPAADGGLKVSCFLPGAGDYVASA
jgi:two-component system, NarL family, sensor histidine kinase UhpB